MYNYWLDLDAQQAFNHEVDLVGKYEVSAGDMLQYNWYDPIRQEDNYKHASVVVSTEAAAPSGTRPATIKWKWGQSAIYSYETSDNYAWDTPYNTCLNPGVPLDDQDGVWNERAPHYTAGRTYVYTPD